MLKKGIVITPDDCRGVDWADRMADLGLNTIGFHSGGGAAHDAEAALGPILSPAFKQAFRAKQIDVEYELHCPWNLLPRHWFDSHPEFFAFNAKHLRREKDWNWCVSQPRCRRILCENAVAMAGRLAPSSHRYFFWGLDEVDSCWCHCPQCASLSPSDQYLLSINALAQAIGVENPTAKVAYLAYHSTLETPEVTPDSRVFLEFAPYHRCYEHAIDDPACAVNRRYWRYLRQLLQVFPAATAHVLEYWLDSSWYNTNRENAHELVCPERTMQRDLEAYHQLGIRSISSFAVFLDGEYFRKYGDRPLLKYAEFLDALH